MSYCVVQLLRRGCCLPLALYKLPAASMDHFDRGHGVSPSLGSGHDFFGLSGRL